MMVERNFDNNNENCIEFLSGERYAVATFTKQEAYHSFEENLR